MKQVSLLVIAQLKFTMMYSIGKTKAIYVRKKYDL